MTITIAVTVAITITIMIMIMIIIINNNKLQKILLLVTAHILHEKVSVHQIKNSPGTSGPRIGPDSRRVLKAINSTENVYHNDNNNNNDNDNNKQQYNICNIQRQVLKHERSKSKNSITKNATKFKGEVTMPEFENKEHKSASENDKVLKHMFKSKMKSIKEEKWINKALHGQYPRILEKPHVDTVTTNKWLSSNLKGETEGLLVAAQDQAINTRNYQKIICGQQVESKCRMC